MYNCFDSVTDSMRVVCDNCGKSFSKRRGLVEKSKHNFCTRKCFGIYKTKHKLGFITGKHLDTSQLKKLKRLADNGRIVKEE